MYSGGEVYISATSDVISVISTPNCEFTITNGIASFYPSARTDFTNIVVSYGSVIYDVNPSCEAVDVDSVKLNVDTIRIHIGDTYELTSTVYPANATNKNVTWMSADPSIATVVDGVVTGITEGTGAAIVMSADDGSKFDVCVIIVLGDPNINVVEWNPDWLKIDIENFTAATATLED